MSNQMTLPGIGNATSLPGSEDGPSPHGSPAGPTTASYGPAPRRASRSASRERSEAPTTNGTCGPTSFASSVPDGPLSSWESRLRQRLARIGSTECALIWKASATPAGRPLSRLVPSTRPTAVTVSGSSPAEAALWVTASARDWKDTPGMAAQRADGRSRIDQLPRQVFAALWSTATATDARRGVAPPRPQDTGTPLGQQLGATFGGCFAMTGKRAEFNPEFSRWEMGFPPEWDACAPTETRSSRRSRRK